MDNKIKTEKIVFFSGIFLIGLSFLLWVVLDIGGWGFVTGFFGSLLTSSIIFKNKNKNNGK